MRRRASAASPRRARAGARSRWASPIRDGAGAHAATADVAATLVANAVDIDSPAIRRRPARELDPDSDLRDLPVTVSVGLLTPAEIEAALAPPALERARDYRERGLIADAALMLQGRSHLAWSWRTRSNASPLPAQALQQLGRGIGVGRAART